MKALTIKNKHFRVTHRGRGYEESGNVCRYKSPWDNLLYNILIQAVRDNDIDYLKHGDGLYIWEYLKGVKTR